MKVSWPHLVIPAVLLNIFFLAVSSQWLFSRVQGFRLTNQETRLFSFLCVNIFICYIRCCVTNPGAVPSQRQSSHDIKVERERWCRKCANLKPPRSHHCSQCQKCIPKMDHHCVWIVNCVSYRIFPHFFRVLFYNVIGMSYLQYFILLRFAIIWSNRHLPSYLGPSPSQLVHLLLLLVSNSITLFALFLMFCKTLYIMAFNTTTIEGWEIERHQTLVRRARSNGGYAYGPNGVMMKIEKQEFPYDIGIWKNLVQCMGTANVLAWFWSLSRSLPLDGGLSFEVNDFEDPSKQWPPPDPEKIPISRGQGEYDNSGSVTTPDYSTQSAVDAFRHRQARDIAMRATSSNKSYPRQPYSQSNSENEDDDESFTKKQNVNSFYMKQQTNTWKNMEGERLGDFGVDEEEELYNEDNIPLSKLIQEKRASAKP